MIHAEQRRQIFAQDGVRVSVLRLVISKGERESALLQKTTNYAFDHDPNSFSHLKKNKIKKWGENEINRIQNLF